MVVVVMGLSTVMMAIVGVLRVVDDLKTESDMGLRSFCS